MKTKQTATGFLAAIIIGLIIGVPLYFAVVWPSEQEKRTQMTILQDTQALDRHVGKWSKQAMPVGR